MSVDKVAPTPEETPAACAERLIAQHIARIAARLAAGDDARACISPWVVA